MVGRNLGAIVFGIGEYPKAGLARLQFAAADASAVHQHLSTCWPDDNATILRIEEAEATLEGVRQAFGYLSKQAPYSLLLVYFSGHGATGDRPGLLLQPSNEGELLGILSPGELHVLFQSIAAEKTLLILDCCFAEAIASGIEHFRKLEASEARLYLASSRADQLTWEEEHAGHSIFTAHLLDAVSDSRVARPSSRDYVDVQSEMFPFLREQVPLYVLEHKSARQEPVLGGTSSAAIRLPTKHLARRLNDRSPFHSALVRFRQILSIAAACLLIGLCVVHHLLFFAEVDADGEVVLRHGMRWMGPVLKFVPDLRVRTGIAATELSPDASVRYSIQTGAMTGIWTQMSAGGYRSWYDELSSALTPRSRSLRGAFLGLDAEPNGSPIAETAPLDVQLAAEGSLVRPNADVVRSIIHSLPGGDRVTTDIAPFPVERLDFTVLDLTPDQLVSYARALRLLAIRDADEVLPAYVGFIKAVQEWLFQNADSQRWVESRDAVIDEVASVLPVILRGREPLTVRQSPWTQTLVELASSGYLETAGNAIAKTPALAANWDAIRNLAIAEVSGTLEGGEPGMLRLVAATLTNSARSKEAVNIVNRKYATAGNGETSYLTKFLIEAADRQAVPESILELLLSHTKASLSSGSLEFIDQENARVLSHAAGQLDDDGRAVMRDLVNAVARSITPRSGTLAEIYGALARQNLETKEMYGQILDQASQTALAAPIDRHRDANDVLPGIPITVDVGRWGYALADLAKTSADSDQFGTAVWRKPV